ncbi:DUF817 domain-containing protein [Streptomyces sp. M600PL45_2]|uniref:DUF817 domain-containing protein n=1 Tax=Streptomyces marispadix TaxID=2922868 RepID=A0ABS9T659_9ACTN|nr:DUF817 domain-containing protein [Streptomyces marispadix]MCH6163975.1 DUF817 domain-containing protein [Streptomyces marispadix]
MDAFSRAVRRLLLFGWLQARCCAFAAALLGGIAASRLLPELPVARYDIVLVYGVVLAVVARRAGWDSGRDTVVIAGCHVIGLLFELVKVRLGSWSYPEAALTKIGGVPLYGGFLYSAVGSYVCRAWRLLDLGITGYRPRVMAALSAAVYINFFTHHWLPDARWVLALLMLYATAGTWVHYSVGAWRPRMPLALGFTLIGFFLWIAENAATYAGAWSYPDQLEGWQPVSPAKAGAWALLISVTFVLAAMSRKGEGARPDVAAHDGAAHIGTARVGTARVGTAHGGFEVRPPTSPGGRRVAARQGEATPKRAQEREPGRVRERGPEHDPEYEPQYRPGPRPRVPR